MKLAFDQQNRKNNKKGIRCRLLHFVCAIPRAHANTHTTSLMHAENSTHHFCLIPLLFGPLE